MKYIEMIVKIIAIVTLSLISSSVGVELHSKCQLESGVEGVCERFQNCASAKQLVKNGRFPVLCSFEFVCCEPVVEPSTEGPVPESHLSRLSSIFLVSTSCYSGRITEQSASNSDEFLYRTVSNQQDDSDKGRINFLVKIGYRRTNGDVHYFCGGTLITPQFVLTAAHCTNYKGQGPEVVQIGNSAVSQGEDEEDNSERIPIAKVHLHPEYSNSVMYNDIALLELAVSSSHLPACLAHHPINDPKTDTAFALGHDLRGQAELQAMNLALISHDYCNELYMHMRKVPHGMLDSQLCLAKSNITDSAACKRFIGGPLLVRRPSGEFHVIGLANYVQQCYSTIYPMIYTRISSYKDWLHSIID